MKTDVMSLVPLNVTNAVVKYQNGNHQYRLFGADNQIQDLFVDGKPQAKVVTNRGEKLSISVLPENYTNKGNSQFPPNMEFEFGPFVLKFSNMTDKGNLLTEEEKIKLGKEFTILPPNTKFDGSFSSNDSNKIIQNYCKKLNILPSEYLKLIASNLGFLEEHIKDHMWEFFKNTNKGNDAIGKAKVDAMKQGQTITHEQAIDKARVDFKNSVKCFVSDKLNDTQNGTDSYVKVEKYCYRNLTEQEMKDGKLELWRQQVNTKGLQDDDRFRSLFDHRTQEDLNKKVEFSPRIYAHYPVFERVNPTSLLKYEEGLRAQGKTEEEVKRAIREVNKDRSQLIQINLAEFVPYEKDITDLKYVDKNLLVNGDTVAVRGRFNIYTAPNYGIRFFFNRVTKLNEKREETLKNRSVIKNPYLIDDDDEGDNADEGGMNDEKVDTKETPVDDPKAQPGNPSVTPDLHQESQAPQGDDQHEQKDVTNLGTESRKRKNDDIQEEKKSKTGHGSVEQVSQDNSQDPKQDGDGHSDSEDPPESTKSKKPRIPQKRPTRGKKDDDVDVDDDDDDDGSDD